MKTETNQPASDSAKIRSAWPYLAMIIIALVIFLPVTFLPGGTAATAPERFAQVGAAFATLPDWVRQWMTFQRFVFAGSLLFVFWHKEARV